MHRTFYLEELGDYFLETRSTNLFGSCDHFNVKMVSLLCIGGMAVVALVVRGSPYVLNVGHTYDDDVRRTCRS